MIKECKIITPSKVIKLQGSKSQLNLYHTNKFTLNHALNELDKLAPAKKPVSNFQVNKKKAGQIYYRMHQT